MATEFDPLKKKNPALGFQPAAIIPSEPIAAAALGAPKPQSMQTPDGPPAAAGAGVSSVTAPGGAAGLGYTGAVTEPTPSAPATVGLGMTPRPVSAPLPGPGLGMTAGGPTAPAADVPAKPGLGIIRRDGNSYTGTGDLSGGPARIENPRNAGVGVTMLPSVGFSPGADAALASARSAAASRGDFGAIRESYAVQGQGFGAPGMDAQSERLRDLALGAPGQPGRKFAQKLMAEGQGDATTRRGQDLAAGTARYTADSHAEATRNTNQIAKAKLQLDQTKAASEEGRASRIAQLDDMILNGNPLQQKQAATQKAAIMGKGADESGRPPSGYRTKADGTLEFIPGGPADPNTKPAGGKPLNDTQAKALQFGSRMQNAGEILDDLATKGVVSSVPGARADGIFGTVANALQPEDQQRLDQAKRDFINAVLRRESGAAISPSEFENAEKQYFPQPGEGAKQQEQKRQARMLSMNGILAEVPEGDARVAQVRGKTAAASAQRAGGTGTPSTPAQASPAAQGAAVPVADAAAYAALPRGAQYVGPDGVTRRKG